MKLGTLISVSGVIDYRQSRENRFQSVKRSEEAKTTPARSPKPGRLSSDRLGPATDSSSAPSDRFRRICLWLVVALLCLAAVA